MSGSEVAGLAIVFVGLLFMLIGLLLAWREAGKAGGLGPASDFVDSLARLIQALSGQRTSVILFSFGVLLIFLGAAFLGVTALT